MTPSGAFPFEISRGDMLLSEPFGDLPASIPLLHVKEICLGDFDGVLSIAIDFGNDDRRFVMVRSPAFLEVRRRERCLRSSVGEYGDEVMAAMQFPYSEEVIKAESVFQEESQRLIRAFKEYQLQGAPQ